MCGSLSRRKGCTVKPKRRYRRSTRGYSRSGYGGDLLSRSGTRRQRLAAHRRARRRRLTFVILLAGALASATVFAAVFALERSRGAPEAAPAPAGDRNVIMVGKDDAGNLSQVLVVVGGARGGYSIYTIPGRTLADTPGHGFQRLDRVIQLGGQQLLDQTVANLLQVPLRFHVYFDYNAVQIMAEQAGSIDFKAASALASADGSVSLAAGDNPTSPDKAMSYLKNSVKDPQVGSQVQALFYQGLRGALSARPGSDRRNFARQVYQRIQSDMSAEDFVDLFAGITDPAGAAGVWPLPVRAAGGGQDWYFEPVPDELAALISGSPLNAGYTLEIRNGGVDPAVAGAVTARLAPLRFRLAPASDQSNVGYDTTQIRCGSDAIDQGNQVRNLLGKGNVIKDESMSNKQITVIIGKDLSLQDLQGRQ
ncbi:MAG: LCP family protein [Thermoleophilia bacterium]